MTFTIRALRAPDDYGAVARLVNVIYSEPTTAKQIEEDENKIPPGELHYNDEGKLMGWDRPKWVAEDEHGNVVGYAIAWRAPWTEPGVLIHTLVVDPAYRGRGIGSALFHAVEKWATEVNASQLVDYMRESDEASLDFARHRGYVMERHSFESVLDVNGFDQWELMDVVEKVKNSGITFVTLADEPGEENERKLHELYQVTTYDIPGYNDEFPWFEEWRKWSIGREGVRPEWVHIAKDGDRYVGVVTLQYTEETNAMYHEYTGVLKAYRGRRIGLALKLLALRTAKEFGAAYLRTNNDSLNVPMLKINRDILGFRAEPGHYKMVKELRHS